ncbi:MAG: hypothetical protein NVS3B20_02050 [Polyangiales bacterium]
MSLRRFLLPLALSATALSAGAPGCAANAPDASFDESTAESGAYSASGTCNGLPRLPLDTAPGVCVGVVAQGFIFPRGIVQLPGGDFVVADMAGWHPGRGSVYRLKRTAQGTYTKKQLIANVDRPSGLAIGHDGLVYVGTPKTIFRFNAEESPAPQLTTVIDDMPDTGRHPLKAFVFDGRDPNTLYVNVGSDSDVCEQPDGTHPAPCPQYETRGVIRKYELSGPQRLGAQFTTIAHGLRNSMALAVHPRSNLLLQGENSRDSISDAAPQLANEELDLPHDELNVVTAKSHYGWPYCYDNGVRSPEYDNANGPNCSKFTNPALLLPGHTAPLGMKYYFGNLFPSAYQGNLILAYHGYRAYGHRLVMVPTDSRGVPNGDPLDIIRGWEKTANNPQGAPVDVMIAKDGSIVLTDDKNGAVLRVFFDRSQGTGAPMTPLPVAKHVPTQEEQSRCAALSTKTNEFARLQRNVIDTHCVSCHGAGPGFPGSLALLKCDDIGNAQRLLAARPHGLSALVTPGNLQSELVLRLKGQGFPKMPARGVPAEGLKAVEDWIAHGAPISH